MGEKLLLLMKLVKSYHFLVMSEKNQCENHHKQYYSINWEFLHQYHYQPERVKGRWSFQNQEMLYFLEVTMGEKLWLLMELEKGCHFLMMSEKNQYEN